MQSMRKSIENEGKIINNIIICEEIKEIPLFKFPWHISFPLLPVL